MRRLLGVALTLLAVTAPPATAASCKKRKSETVVARSSAAVITRAGNHQSNYLYRGCLFARDHRYRTFAADPAGYPYEIDYVDKIKLAGPYAALAVDRSQKGDTAVQLLVTDLRNGRQGAVTAGRDYAATGSDSYTLERLALSKHGAVAWRGTHVMGYPGTEETVQKVTVADSHGTRVLDSAAPGSLGGPLFPDPRTVAWSREGSHSARAYYGLPRG